MRLFTWVTLISSFLSFIALEGHEPYRAKVRVSTNVFALTRDAKFAAPTILNLAHDLDTASITKAIPTYKTTTETHILFNLRGVHAKGVFPTNSNALGFTIPELAITKVFTGSTRDESITLMEEFLNTNCNNNRKYLRHYARRSPIDPVAGNPNSLMAQMAQSDYQFSRLSPLAGCDCCWTAQPLLHQFDIGFNAGRSFARSYDSTVYNLPVRYSFSPDRQWALIVDMPLSLIKNGGAYSYFGSLGFGFRIPVNRMWAVTASYRTGLSAIGDLNSGGSFVSPGVSSIVNWCFCDYVVSMTNYFGYFASTPLHLNGVDWNYRLRNCVFKNGLNVSSCEGFAYGGKVINYSVWFIDSIFTGKSLYMDHWDEVGMSLNMANVNPCLCFDCLSVGVSFVIANKSCKHNFRNWMFNLCYEF